MESNDDKEKPPSPSSEKSMRKSSFSGGSVKKNKSVTFADDIGKQLCTIQLYTSNETFTLAWDQQIENNTQSNGHQMEDYSLQRSKSLPSNSSPDAAMSNNLYSTSLLRHGICALSLPYRNWIYLFDTNSLVFDPSIHIIKLTKINVIVINGIPKVCGMITVKNLTYHKHVFIRYTFYEWKSHNDRYAYFHIHDENHNTDIFKFCIPLIISGNNSRNFEFALSYETEDGHAYWDNNSGQNYRIRYKSNCNRPKSAATTSSSSSTSSSSDRTTQ